jgi:hypothetical protein
VRKRLAKGTGKGGKVRIYFLPRELTRKKKPLQRRHLICARDGGEIFIISRKIPKLFRENGLITKSTSAGS